MPERIRIIAGEVNPLEEVIRSEIASSGPITFARYMELCLYHPRYGYYMRPRSPRGKVGDYFTSPTVGPLFGKTLARQIAEMADLIPGVFHLVEVGSGEGYLALDILNALKEQAPEVLRRLHYLSVEINPFMVERQKELLKAFKGLVSWPRWKEIGGIRGCILANELLDALPVHRVVLKGGRLKEIFVDLAGSSFCEVLKEPTRGVSSYFRWLETLPPEGCQAEAGISALEWLEGASARLAEGFVLLIDYGHDAKTLLSGAFPQGTLLAYRGHRAHTDFYSAPGADDLTAHVNFTAVLKKARELGLGTLGPKNQGRFLLSLGILDGLEGKEREKERLQAKRLILPAGMGDVFKMLALYKAMDSPRLRGFEEVWP